VTVWRRTRLKYLASGKAGTWGSEPGEAEADVYCVRAADFDRDRFRVSPERLPLRSVDAAVFRELALQPGDLVLEKSGGGADQPVGRSVLFDLDVPAICSNFATRLRPLAETDPRFLTYLMAAAYSRGVTAFLAKQTTGIANLDVGAYMATSWRVPDAAAQGRIADYLDAETARIDVLATAHRRQLGLLALRKRATVSQAMQAHATAEVPVRRLVTTVTSGPRGWSSLEIEGSTQLFLRIANVPADSISLKLEDVAFIDAPDGDESDRCRVKPGDVLTTITAAIGQVAVVPADLGEAYVSQHLALFDPSRRS
jgi:type I restriction enzyme S subunit